LIFWKSISGYRILNKVLNCLEELRQTQKMHSTMLQHIMSKLQMPDEDSPGLPENISFPLGSVEDVNQLEEKLIDGPTKKRLVRLCS